MPELNFVHGTSVIVKAVSTAPRRNPMPPGVAPAPMRFLFVNAGPSPVCLAIGDVTVVPEVGPGPSSDAIVPVGTSFELTTEELFFAVICIFPSASATCCMTPIGP